MSNDLGRTAPRVCCLLEYGWLRLGRGLIISFFKKPKYGKLSNQKEDGKGNQNRSELRSALERANLQSESKSAERYCCGLSIEGYCVFARGCVLGARNYVMNLY